jgi:hypothetical protein
MTIIDKVPYFTKTPSIQNIVWNICIIGRKKGTKNGKND